MTDNSNSEGFFFFWFRTELIFLLLLFAFLWQRCLSSLAVLGSVTVVLFYILPFDPRLVLKLINAVELPELHGDLGLLPLKKGGAVLCDQDRQVYSRICSIFIL